MIQEQINQINALCRQKKLLMKELSDSARPAETDLDKIPSIYQKFKSVSNPNNKDNLKIFIFIVFFMYSPYSCVGRAVRGGVRKRIAKLLSVSNTAISQHFGDAKVLFYKHRGFQVETERIFKALVS